MTRAPTKLQKLSSVTTKVASALAGADSSSPSSSGVTRKATTATTASPTTTSSLVSSFSTTTFRGLSMQAVSYGADFLMVFGTAPGWIAQCRSILSRGTTEGFSWHSPLLLLICYTLRIAYSFGQAFHIALLLQCVVMSIVCLATLAAAADAPDPGTSRSQVVIHVSDSDDDEGGFDIVMNAKHGKRIMDKSQVSIQDRNSSAMSPSVAFPPMSEPGAVEREDNNNSGDDNKKKKSGEQQKEQEEGIVASIIHKLSCLLRCIYKLLKKLVRCFSSHWAGGRYAFGFIPYDGTNTRAVYGIYTIALLLTCYFSARALPKSKGLTNMVGFLALGIEASVMLPQVVLTEQKRSTEGLSKFFVFMWTMGDAGKVLYFIAKAQPLPFLICGTVQFLVDLFIVGQFLRFKNAESGPGDQNNSTSSVVGDETSMHNVNKNNKTKKGGEKTSVL